MIFIVPLNCSKIGLNYLKNNKNMGKEEKRDYFMEDVVMLARGQAMLDSFVEVSNEFTAKFTTFKHPFEDEMQEGIDLCKSSSSDTICKLKIEEKTAIVEAFMKTGRDEFQEGLLYLKIAFPRDSLKFKLYGQPSYDKARVSHVNFPVLLIKAFDMANGDDVKPFLIAKGASQESITMLETTSNLIKNAVRVQTKFKGARTLSAVDRVKNLNAVWAMMVLISDCAKNIYVNNPVMWNRFLLY